MNARASKLCFSPSSDRKQRRAERVRQDGIQPRKRRLFRTRVAPLLSHGALHEQHRECDHKGQCRDHPEGVEIGERGGLLLAQMLELPPCELLRRGGIAGLMQERRPSPAEEGSRGRIERIEGLAKPERVKLIAPLVEGLSPRGPDAAPLVAQETEQADRGTAQRERRIEVGGDVRGSEAYR